MRSHRQMADDFDRRLFDLIGTADRFAEGNRAWHKVASALSAARSAACLIWRGRPYGPELDEALSLSAADMKAQAARCPCRGSDEFCACQNVPDRVTRAARLTSAEADHG